MQYIISVKAISIIEFVRVFDDDELLPGPISRLSLSFGSAEK